MTSKEKVLAVHPEAYTTYNGQLRVTEVWSTPSGGVFLGQAPGRWGSEEAAWQNAAESLPAEPEHCPNCNHKAHYALRCGALIATGSDGEFAEEVRCECLNWVAEPKPAPSEPDYSSQEEIINRAKWRLMEAIDAWPLHIQQYQRLILDIHGMLEEALNVGD